MSNSSMPFGKKNYTIMLAGIIVLIIGFIIMANDSKPYGLGFNGITLGPIVVMSGFILELFAITRKPKVKE